MMDIGKKIKEMVKDGLNIQAVQFMMEDGKKDADTGKEYISSPMAKLIMEIGWMENEQDMVLINGQVETFILENGKTMKKLMGCCLILIIVDMRVNFLMILCMDMVLSHILRERDMKDNGKRILKMVEGSLYNGMVE